jgi:zinc protease
MFKRVTSWNVCAPLTAVAVLSTLGAQALAARSAQPPAPVERPATPAPKPDASKPPTPKTATPKTAQPPASAPSRAAAAPKVEFEKYTLPNGLQVILHVDRKLPIVHVNQWFHVGSKNEKPGRTGFAHLFEHMMFQGSKNVPGEYFNIAEQAGANLQEGGVNGTTDNDRTNYFATVPSGNLEALLWLESDRLATLLDVTDIKKLDNQRDVVKNERRQSLENQPYGRWLDIVFDQLFPRGHPYSWPVIGSMEDLSAASLDDVKEFFRRYYTPNNLSMVIAGDFDPAQAKTLVAKYFGGIPPGPPLDRPAHWIPALTSERIVEVADRVPQERTYMVWPGPEYFGADDAALNMASRILTDGLSSRLNKALVYDKQLCTAVTSFTLASEIAGGIIVQVTARPEASLAEIEKIVTEQIALLAKTGPTQAELDRARTKQEFEFISGLERIGGFGGKSDLLNQYNVYLGDPGKFDEDLARYRKLSVGDVRSAVDRWMNTRNRLLIRFHPEKSGRPAESTLDRSKQPAFGQDRPFKAPTVQTTKLENGVELFVVERSDLPKVAITVATRAGSVADPAGKDGLASMVIRTIDMGTKTRKTLDIENAFGDLGVTLTGNPGREYSFLAFEVLKRNLSPALGIVSDVVQHATFPDVEVEREKKRQLDALAQQEKNGNAVANRVRNILAYGADHPYGRPTAGLPRTVQSFTQADLVAFHRDRWKPGSSAIVFVGGITLDEATALARQHFGAWSGGAAAPVTIPAPRPAAPGKLYLVDRQDSAQTVVQQYLPAPRRDTSDYYPLLLADAVWGGGGFGTRLNLNLREDKGYSYGVSSALLLLREAGTWIAAGGVQTDKTKEAVAEFEKELKALPITELQREYDETAKATLDATLAAAKKYARPERAGTLLVGDRGKIEAGLRDLKIGDVVIVDSEGKPVTGGAAASSSSR